MKNWEIGPFHKLPEPILKADSTLQFHCPVQNKTEKWANNGVYNPSAAVVNGMVHMVYRADGELPERASRTIYFITNAVDVQNCRFRRCGQYFSS